MDRVSSVNDFFDDALQDLSCDPKTRAYVVSIFTKFAKTPFDLPSQSITLTYFQAKQNQDFAIYQSLGDWIFFCRVEFPDHLTSFASDDYCLTVGRLSYLSCYRLLKRQWLLYQELADRFIELENEARELLTTALPKDTQPPRLVL